METIGIGEIQKNTSLLSNLTESLEIVDKRRKCTVAIVHPVKKINITSKLAGKYKNHISAKPLTTKQLSKAKEQVMLAAMEEKYGLTD